MRIIAGTHRGKKLVSPEGENTRPTHDRTREAVFSALQTRLYGARVLDCFAGSGAMALAALSRGAAQALLLEKDENACRVIRQNIELTREEEKARLVCGDAIQLLQALPAQVFDLVFLDPPYGKGLIEQALKPLLSRRLLAEDALLVAETAAGETLLLPPEISVVKERKYGKNLIRFLAAVPCTEGDVP